ncbi:uncharacterized protein LOC110271994 [Arachis ipaensis]|uniref:uncharacterized protein LOC110271994 n=1 Tax=Arachis ipaensis TaxID=130454 RepID=UPI000A2B7FE4|nr:uncharacterized protein LOC110271994 [Arachis ipaensis]
MDIPWELFWTAFYKKYFPESVREARELEFMQLKQGSMPVAEYTSKFEELCRFSRICQGAPESYEGWKCENYQVGLREDIMRVVAPIEIKRFSELVNEVRFVEDYIKKMTLTRDNHRVTSSRGRGKHFPPRGRILKRDGRATQHRQGQRNFRRNNKAQLHLEKGDVRCYTCGKPGHISKYCHHGRNRDEGQNQQSGRVFTLCARSTTGSDSLTRVKAAVPIPPTPQVSALNKGLKDLQVASSQPNIKAVFLTLHRKSKASIW